MKCTGYIMKNHNEMHWVCNEKPQWNAQVCNEKPQWNAQVCNEKPQWNAQGM